MAFQQFRTTPQHSGEGLLRNERQNMQAGVGRRQSAGTQLGKKTKDEQRPSGQASAGVESLGPKHTSK